MIIFGHLGIPLAVAQIYQSRIKKPGPARFIESLDYRVFLSGALLPDIIDKSASLTFGKVLGTTQSFGHTLIFAILMFITGLIFYKKHDKSFLLILAIGICSHHILDLVTMNYKNFFWPIYGFKFIQSQSFKTNLFKKLIQAISSPYYLAGEMIGFPIVAYYTFKLYFKKRFLDFIKTGRITN